MKKKLLEKRQKKKRKTKEEAIQENIVELEKAIAQEDLNLEQEVQDQEGLTKEKTKESQDDVGGEDQRWIPVQNDPEDLPSTLENILTRGNLPLVELEFVPFTPSKKYEVAFLEVVQFDPKKNSIMWKTEKTLRIGNQPPVTTVTERIVVKNVEDNPKQLASLGIANAYVNAHNIHKLAQTLEQCKYKMVVMKEVLRKEERVCRE